MGIKQISNIRIIKKQGGTSLSNAIEEKKKPEDVDIITSLEDILNLPYSTKFRIDAAVVENAVYNPDKIIRNNDIDVKIWKNLDKFAKKNNLIQHQYLEGNGISTFRGSKFMDTRSEYLFFIPDTNLSLLIEFRHLDKKLTEKEQTGFEGHGQILEAFFRIVDSKQPEIIHADYFMASAGYPRNSKHKSHCSIQVSGTTLEKSKKAYKILDKIIGNLLNGNILKLDLPRKDMPGIIDNKYENPNFKQKE